MKRAIFIDRSPLFQTISYGRTGFARPSMRPDLPGEYIFEADGPTGPTLVYYLLDRHQLYFDQDGYRLL